MEGEVIEGQADEVSTDLTIHPPAVPTNLFRTDSPVQVLERATETANALRDVIRKQHLAVKIEGRWHITVEGWQTLGAMLGITPVCEWTRPVENGWEARVIAQTLDGRTVGAAEAQCLSTEGKPWNKAKDYALRSMAQTRATSKALASVLRFVATLGGYEGTPAEDAEGIPQAQQPKPEPKPAERHRTIEEVSQSSCFALIEKRRSEGMTFDNLALVMGSCGIDAPRARSVKAVKERLAELTDEQLAQLEGEL